MTKVPNSRVIRFVDLFAGIGGIRAGFQIAASKFGERTECVFSSEIDPEARTTYKLNYQEESSGDIRAVDELPPHDVLLAGFPCQTFSYAGKKKGFADTRGTLFFEIERLLERAAKKPSLVLLENVRGFTSHDRGRTFATVKARMEALGYGVKSLLLNSSNFGVPQNRVRVYMICTFGRQPHTALESDLGAADSHQFKRKVHQGELFSANVRACRVSDVLDERVPDKYLCSPGFIAQLRKSVGDDFQKLHGVRLIDYRGGNSIHSWDLGLKGACTGPERRLMNALISNRRKKHFGEHQDGKRLSKKQIATFWPGANLGKLLKSLVAKGYLKCVSGTYNPVCGNMSFEVFKFLDPASIAITIVSSDAHRLGVVHGGAVRRITPRECARLQGFPDSFVLHTKDSLAYKQLGNSVSVPVIVEIFNDLLDQEGVIQGGGESAMLFSNAGAEAMHA